MALDALREFKAGQAGHLDVGHQQVGLEPLQLAPGGLAIGGGGDHLDVGFHAEQRGQRTAQHRLILGEDDADHAGADRFGMRATLADRPPAPPRSGDRIE